MVSKHVIITVTLFAVSLALPLLHVTYLQHYMLLCRWKHSKHGLTAPAAGADSGVPWLRLAFLADPQLEGDTRVWRQGWFGQLNNDLNDYYFRHIARSIRRYLRPRQLLLLGDLFSFQYTSDREFHARTGRFRSIFEHSKECGIYNNDDSNGGDGDTGSGAGTGGIGGTTDLAAVYQINLAGNHDVGYGAEMNVYVYERFVQEFGPQNTDYELEVGNGNGVDLRLWVGVVDSMSLDGTMDRAFHTEAWKHLEHLAHERRVHPRKPLLLLTHIPLWKAEGSCMDVPSITMQRHAVAEQNTLSRNATAFILDHIRPSMVFSGHDHEGCEYTHRNSIGEEIPEHTVRSVMGDFGGVTAVLEVSHDSNNSSSLLSFHYYSCPFVTVKYLVVTLIFSGLCTVFCTMYLLCIVLLQRHVFRESSVVRLKEE